MLILVTLTIAVNIFYTSRSICAFLLPRTANLYICMRGPSIAPTIINDPSHEVVL